MRPKHKTYTVAAESSTGFVNQATGATSPLTLAATSAGDGLAHQVSITSAGGDNLSGITFTITGTDADGVAQTEDVTGPNNTTVESTKYFLTISSITISASLTTKHADVGWVDEIVTPTMQLNAYSRGMSINVDAGGTVNYTVQATNSDMRTRADDGPFNWFDIDDPNIDLISITADVAFGLFPIPRAIRLKTNSYSSGASLDLYINPNNDLS